MKSVAQEAAENHAGIGPADEIQSPVVKSDDPGPEAVAPGIERDLDDAIDGGPEQFAAPAYLPGRHVLNAMSSIQRAFAAEGISKGHRNKEQGYEFRGIDQVLERLSPLMAEHGLLIIPRTLERTMTEHETRNGGVRFKVVLKVLLKFVSTVDDSVEFVEVYGEGDDSSDKGSNKALTAAYKYAVLTAFAIPIPTTVDNDADATTGEGLLPSNDEAKFQRWVTELKKEKTYDALVAKVQAGDEGLRARLRRDTDTWAELKAKVASAVTK